MRGGFGLNSRLELPRFRSRFPWYGGDLQTLRNYLVPRQADLSPWPEERVEIDAGDGTGDRLLAALHRPAERAERPLVVLVHGLTGCEGSFYVLETARSLLAAGYPVLRLNLRGAGPARATCTEQYCAGSSDDLGVVLRALEGEVSAHGFVLVGYSLGGNIVLKYLAEAPAERRPLYGAAVSTPLDLRATALRMMAPRNALYQRWLLNRMKQEAVAGAARTTAAERRAIESARSVYEYDDLYVAPRHGYSNAEAYYRGCSAAGFLKDIETPTLILHADNDPWIPIAIYQSIDWDAFPMLTPAIAASGGHVGFHGQDGETPWHNACLYAFINEHGIDQRRAATGA